MAIVVTFLLTTGLWLGLLAFALRRVVRHMQQNPDAVKAVSEHVLVPLFGRKEKTGGQGERVRGAASPGAGHDPQPD